MDYVMLASFVFGGVAGYRLRRLTTALVVAAIAGLGTAITYYLWLNADATRGDALEGVGYVMALIYPLGGCALGLLGRRVKRKSG